MNGIKVQIQGTNLMLAKSLQRQTTKRRENYTAVIRRPKGLLPTLSIIERNLLCTMHHSIIIASVRPRSKLF